MTTHTQPAAEIIAEWSAGIRDGGVPDSVSGTLRRTVLDALGLMVAARNEVYVKSAVNSADVAGGCTVVGHDGGYDPMTAALANGMAVHGEDFDDTFEGTPVHVGSVMVPVLLAAAEQQKLSGADILNGLAAGAELICRLALVAPTAIHRQGFHPTAICGSFGAALGAAVALRLSPKETASALGIVGSMSSGIIEYLAEGTWTKRMHPGWAAGAGWRAARLAQAGFVGPRTVFEGEHGAFFAFAKDEIDRDYSHLTEAWGDRWEVASLAFKPYACGTMAQPFIDCALQLRDKIPALDQIKSIDAKVGEGTVHRLWEPRAEKVKPSTPYGAKFSVPYCVAVALADGEAGLGQYTEERILDAVVLAQAEKVKYEIDPNDEYPRNYTGYLKITMQDGSTHEARQPCLRGGRQAPLDDTEIEAKYDANTRFGGWDDDRAGTMKRFAHDLFNLPDISGLRAFAG